MTLRARLRTCASCEWIFSLDGALHAETGGCPKCGWAHYSARYVYGNRAYRYAVTQKPWCEKKLANFAVQLHREIAASK